MTTEPTYQLRITLTEMRVLTRAMTKLFNMTRIYPDHRVAPEEAEQLYKVMHRLKEASQGPTIILETT